MKIEFKNVKMENFLSYKEAFYSFDRKGFIKVVGSNNNSEMSESVGSGKSSLFSSIIWCLTGLTSNGLKDVANIYNDEKCYVDLEFSIDDKHYKVIRSKRPSNLEIFFNGKNISGKGIRDTEKILEEHLGQLTHSLLSSVVILGQGLPYRLSNNSPSGRKEILEKLSNSDFMIEDLKDRVAKRENELKSEKREIEDNSIKVSTNLSNLEKSIESDITKLNELNNTDVSSLEIELSSLNTKDLENGLNRLENLQLDRDEKVKKGNEYLRALSEKRVELVDVTELNNKLTELRVSVNSKKEELNRLKNIKTECPTCKQKLPHVHKVDTTELEMLIKDLISEGMTVKREYDEIVQSNNEKEQRFNQAKLEKKKEIEEKLNSLVDYSREIKEKRDKIYQYKLRENQIKNELSNLESNKKTLEISIEEQTKEIDVLKEEQEKDKERLDKLSNSLQTITKMTTLLKRDFRGYLLKNVIDYLQSRLSEYSEKVFGNKKLTLEIEGNNLNIKYNQKLYESLSGGEKTKVDIIIQLSIRDLLCNQFNFSSNILVIDEVTDFLDERSADKVYELFTEISVDSVYIISHRKDFTIPVDNYVFINKEDNYSYIV